MNSEVKEKIAVIMGSNSDYEFMKNCLDILDKFEVYYEVFVKSAHWGHDDAAEFAKNLEKNEFDIIIAAAGKASFLPSFIAAYTMIPVIGLVVKGNKEDESFPSMMGKVPKGVSIGTVINNSSENAALFSIQLCSLKNSDLRKKMITYRNEMKQKNKLKEVCWKDKKCYE